MSDEKKQKIEDLKEQFLSELTPEELMESDEIAGGSNINCQIIKEPDPC